MPVPVAVQKSEKLVGRVAGTDRPDQGGRIVGHQHAGQGQQPDPGIVTLRRGHHPGARPEGARRAHPHPPVRAISAVGVLPESTAMVEDPAARAAVSDARRSRTPAPSTEHTAGQGYPEAFAPSAVEAAFGQDGGRSGRAVRIRNQGHQTQRLGGRQLVGQEGGQGAGSPIGRTVAAQDDGRVSPPRQTASLRAANFHKR